MIRIIFLLTFVLTLLTLLISVFLIVKKNNVRQIRKEKVEINGPSNYIPKDFKIQVNPGNQWSWWSEVP